MFFDIDGTLLDEKESVVPESTGKALQMARKQGHLLLICSGRCKLIIPESIMQLGFHGMIGGCGTYVEYQGEVLYHKSIEESMCRELVEDLYRYHIDGVLEGKDVSAFRKDIWMPVVKEIYGENSTFKPAADATKIWEETTSFDKMALWYDASSDMAAFQKKWEFYFDFIDRDPTFKEVVPRSCSKATGIDRICEYLHVLPEDTLSFGDSTNDLPMLLHTGHSVAMGSGNPVLFDQVDYVAPAVMEDGIYKGMEHFGLLGE